MTTDNFIIRDKNGNKIPFNRLDKEVCDFWGIDKTPNHFASPIIVPAKGTVDEKGRLSVLQRKIVLNWIDQIGGVISRGAGDWQTVREKWLWPYLKEGFALDDIMLDPASEKLYKLIEYFEDKEYVPVPL